MEISIMKKYFCVFLLVMLVVGGDLGGKDSIKDHVSRLYIQHKELEKRFIELKERYNVRVTVTAYSPSVEETDGTPYITSSLLEPKPWTVAVSRDLYNNGWTEGKYIYINQIGRFRILDKMNHRKYKSVDIFFSNKKQAIRFGIRKNILIALLDI